MSLLQSIKKTASGLVATFKDGSQAGIDFKARILTNLSQAGFANNTPGDIAGSSMTLPAGAYIVEFGGNCYSEFSGTFTSGFGIVNVTDAANNILAQIGNAASMWPNGATTAANAVSSIQIINLATATTIKLRGVLRVNGATPSNMQIGFAYLKVTPV